MYKYWIFWIFGYIYFIWKYSIGSFKIWKVENVLIIFILFEDYTYYFMKGKLASEIFWKMENFGISRQYKWRIDKFTDKSFKLQHFNYV